jgi:hypothetical protein
MHCRHAVALERRGSEGIEHYESYYGDAAEGSIDPFFLLFNR